MTAVESSPRARPSAASTTWTCQQFRVDGVTVGCSADMHYVLRIDRDGAATVCIGGIIVTGVVGAQGDGLVYQGVLRTDAPWTTPAGSCEDRLSGALTGRLRCRRTRDRLTLSSGGAVLHFVLGS